MATVEDLAERVERLLLRHEELQRTAALLEQQLASVAQERDSLRSRLNAARSRIDALLARLPSDAAATEAAGAAQRGEPVKQMEVTIMGQSYVLGCPEGGDRALLAAVGRVDREMSAIRDAGRVRARERIAVLAALNLAYALAEDAGRASDATPGAAAGGVDVAALVARIDRALGADGQLL